MDAGIPPYSGANAFPGTGSAYGPAGSAFGPTGSAYGPAGSAFGPAGSAYGPAGGSYGRVNDAIQRSMSFPYSTGTNDYRSGVQRELNYDPTAVYDPKDSPRDIMIYDLGGDLMGVHVPGLSYQDTWIRQYSGGDRVRHVVNDFYREKNGQDNPEIYWTNWRCNGRPLTMEIKLRDLAVPAPQEIIDIHFPRNYDQYGYDSYPYDPYLYGQYGYDPYSSYGYGPYGY